MGCISSSNAREDPKKINFTFGYTNVYNLDYFFARVRDVLSDIEKIRSGIEDNRERLINESYAIYLKQPSFREAIKIMFWCISANNQGSISNCNPKVEPHPPFFTLTLSNMRYETSKLWTYFHDYLQTLIEGPAKIADLIKDFIALAEEAPGYVNRAGEEATRSGQGPIQKAQSVVTTTANVNIIKNQIDKVKRVPEVLEDAKKEMETLIEFLNEQVRTCDEVGKPAYEAKKVLPKDIFDTYHNGAKKTPEEIQALVASLSSENSKKK